MRFDQKLQDIGQAFAGAADEKTLFSIAGRALADYGCDHFIFGDGAKYGSQISVRTVSLYHETFPSDFWSVLQGQSPFVDNLVSRRYIRDGLDSFFDDPQILVDATPAELAHLNRVREAGYRQGYFQVFDNRMGHKAGIGFQLDQYSKSDLALIWPELKPQLTAIGQMLDTAFFTTHIAAHYGLAPRERDVLSWLAAGLRPDEIADKLAIGYRTVDKYIVSAKEKLNARTRDHAVARAVILKLI